jgi:hypothetical protein
MAGHRIGGLLALSIATLALCLTLGDRALAQMPAAIAAPGQPVVATLHASGAQIYDCKPGKDGKLNWVFREPVATLILDGKTVGRHYAGPTWEHTDGSAVTGKVAATAPAATANDVPWLKLDVVGRRGNGTLADVTTVQRINTNGGVLVGACDQAGDLHSVPYSADYVFLRPGG